MAKSKAEVEESDLQKAIEASVQGAGRQPSDMSAAIAQSLLSFTSNPRTDPASRRRQKDV